MNVLMVGASDFRGAGGTSVVTYTLHKAYLRRGIHSRILCSNKTVNAKETRLIGRKKLIESPLRAIYSRMGLNDLHAQTASAFMNDPWFKEADVVHFHGLHGGYFNFTALPEITRVKPAAWTFHDTWALSGHCSFYSDCLKWQTGCGKCPYPGIWPPIKRDATAYEWKLKERAYRDSRFTIIAPSLWMNELVSQSMLRAKPVRLIPNGIDDRSFRPLERSACRRSLGLSDSDTVLLFGALDFNDHRKGADLLLKALITLPETVKKGMVLMIMGENSSAFAETAGMRTLDLGWIDGDKMKAIVMSAADVFVSPTRMENCSLAVLESMACAVPAVSFAIPAMLEMVRHGETGLLARPEDAADLAVQLERALTDPALRDRLGAAALAYFKQKYTLDKQVEAHLALYEDLIKGSAA